MIVSSATQSGLVSGEIVGSLREGTAAMMAGRAFLGAFILSPTFDSASSAPRRRSAMVSIFFR